MNREKQNRSAWLRVGLLTLTTVGPIVNTLLERIRQRAQSVQKQAAEVQETARSAPATALDRLDEFTHAGRQRAAEQARQLEKQARQLRSQARRLRKALRHEAQQRRKLNKTVKQLREAGIDWSQELLKRSEELTEGLVLQSSQVTQGLVKRGAEFSRDLAERSGKVTRDLAERGEQLLQPVRRRTSTFWTIFGFSFGLLAAAAVTYFFVRKRLVEQGTEQDQPIELPQELNVASNRPLAGEIRHINNDRDSVATLQAVEVDAGEVKAPEDAAFVGVVSTKHYYPIDTPLDHLLSSGDKAKDLVYFASEEEAQTQGFTAAE